MATVIFSPTPKLIPDTVSWPEKPVKGYYDNLDEYDKYAYSNAVEKYHEDITEASRHLVDIAEEDWDAITKAVMRERLGMIVAIVDDGPLDNFYRDLADKHVRKDTPYTIDAEFEVGCQMYDGGKWNHSWKDYKEIVFVDQYMASCYRQIARLVKPKEVTVYTIETTTTDIKVYKDGALLKSEGLKSSLDVKPWNPNPTGPAPTGKFPSDSVTSDGTKVEQTEAEKLADIPWKPQPTESQDELWDELNRDCRDSDGFLDIDLARKSFRIERI